MLRVVGFAIIIKSILNLRGLMIKYSKDQQPRTQVLKWTQLNTVGVMAKTSIWEDEEGPQKEACN